MTSVQQIMLAKAAMAGTLVMTSRIFLEICSAIPTTLHFQFFCILCMITIYTAAAGPIPSKNLTD